MPTQPAPATDVPNGLREHGVLYHRDKMESISRSLLHSANYRNSVQESIDYESYGTSRSPMMVSDADACVMLTISPLHHKDVVKPPPPDHHLACFRKPAIKLPLAKCEITPQDDSTSNMQDMPCPPSSGDVYPASERIPSRSAALDELVKEEEEEELLQSQESAVPLPLLPEKKSSEASLPPVAHEPCLAAPLCGDGDAGTSGTPQPQAECLEELMSTLNVEETVLLDDLVRSLLDTVVQDLIREEVTEGHRPVEPTWEGLNLMTNSWEDVFQNPFDYMLNTLDSCPNCGRQISLSRMAPHIVSLCGENRFVDDRGKRAAKRERKRGEHGQSRLTRSRMNNKPPATSASAAAPTPASVEIKPSPVCEASTSQKSLQDQKRTAPAESEETARKRPNVRITSADDFPLQRFQNLPS